MKRFFNLGSKIIFLLAIFLQQNSFGAAWLVEKNKNQLILTNSFIRSNLNGNRYGGNDVPIYLNENSISTYFEHGLFERASVGVNTAVKHKSIDDQVFGENNKRFAMDYAELFVKYYLYRGKYLKVSKQEIFSIPVNKEYYLHRTQSPFTNAFAYETRIMFGLGTSDNGSLVSAILGDTGSFLNVESGYRINFTDPFSQFAGLPSYNELRTQVDIGLGFHGSIVKMLLLQFFKLNKFYQGTNEEYGIMSNGFGYNDITNFAGSLLFKVGHETLLQTGLYFEIRDKFLGMSTEGNHAQGIQLGLWFS